MTSISPIGTRGLRINSYVDPCNSAAVRRGVVRISVPGSNVPGSASKFNFSTTTRVVPSAFATVRVTSSRYCRPSLNVTGLSNTTVPRIAPPAKLPDCITLSLSTTFSISFGMLLGEAPNGTVASGSPACVTVCPSLIDVFSGPRATAGPVICPTFCSSSETPIAVMSTFSRGALRNGRYANRSMQYPTTPHTVTADKNATTTTHQGVTPDGSAILFSTTTDTVKLVHAPSTNTSLCAKLMNFSTPYTSVYPSAISAYKLPTATVAMSI